MNTLSGPANALAFHAGPKASTHLSRFLEAVRTYWIALADGLAAARTYRALISRGETHETAVAKVFHRHFCGR